MQGVLHWVGQPKAGQEPARFEARLYDRLFSTQTPGSKKKVEDGQDPATATGQAAPTLCIACIRLLLENLSFHQYKSVQCTEIPDRIALIL